MKKWKELIDRVKGVHVLIGFMVLLVSVASPFVVKVDKRWANAEQEIINNQQLQESIHLQQQTIQQLNDKFSIDIAKLKWESRKEQYNEFVIEHGDDIKEMDEATKIRFLILKDKLAIALLEYDNLL